MEPQEKVGRTKKQIAVNNFIGGIMWSLGVFVGSTIVIAIIIFFLSKVDLVPIVGGFVSQVTQNVLQNNSQLLK